MESDLMAPMFADMHRGTIDIFLVLFIDLHTPFTQTHGVKYIRRELSQTRQNLIN